MKASDLTFDIVLGEPLLALQTLLDSLVRNLGAESWLWLQIGLALGLGLLVDQLPSRCDLCAGRSSAHRAFHHHHARGPVPDDSDADPSAGPSDRRPGQSSGLGAAADPVHLHGFLRLLVSPGAAHEHRALAVSQDPPQPGTHDCADGLSDAHFRPAGDAGRADGSGDGDGCQLCLSDRYRHGDLFPPTDGAFRRRLVAWSAWLADCLTAVSRGAPFHRPGAYRQELWRGAGDLGPDLRNLRGP